MKKPNNFALLGKALNRTLPPLSGRQVATTWLP